MTKQRSLALRFWSDLDQYHRSAEVNGYDPTIKVLAGSVRSERPNGTLMDARSVVPALATLAGLTPGGTAEISLQGRHYQATLESSASAHLRLRFEDGSGLRFDRPEDDRPAIEEDVPTPTDLALDSGAALLQPITIIEHAAMERLLALLWQAAANDRLTEAQERMTLSIAAMIEKSHRETEPDHTARWKLVGAVSAGLGYLFLNVPDGIIKWNDAIPILQGIHWPNAAGLLGGG